MKITLLNLRLTLAVILLKITIGVLFFFDITQILSSLNFPITAHHLSMLSSYIEIYLFIYLLLFTNRFLLYKKVNLYLITIIIIRTLFIFYELYTSKEDFASWDQIAFTIAGFFILIASFSLCIRLIKYEGILQKQVKLYAIFEIVVFTTQIVGPLISLVFKLEFEITFRYLLALTGFAPNIALGLLYYKACQYINEIDEGESNILDSGEYSV